MVSSTKRGNKNEASERSDAKPAIRWRGVANLRLDSARARADDVVAGRGVTGEGSDVTLPEAGIGEEEKKKLVHALFVVFLRYKLKWDGWILIQQVWEREELAKNTHMLYVLFIIYPN